MVSKRRRDERSIRRRAPYREPKFRILVACEGRVTEPEYIKAFQHFVRNTRVHVELAPETGVPLTVVQIAVQQKRVASEKAKREGDENLVFDAVWAVFDVDEHPHLKDALDLAGREGIRVALSNPNFELWALLHFQDQRAPIDRAEAARIVKTHLPGYEKALEFGRLQPHYQTAVSRAQSLAEEAQHHGSPFKNPTTSVYELTEMIRTQ